MRENQLEAFFKTQVTDIGKLTCIEHRWVLLLHSVLFNGDAELRSPLLSPFLTTVWFPGQPLSLRLRILRCAARDTAHLALTLRGEPRGGKGIVVTHVLGMRVVMGGRKPAFTRRNSKEEVK